MRMLDLGGKSRKKSPSYPECLYGFYLLFYIIYIYIYFLFLFLDISNYILLTVLLASAVAAVAPHWADISLGRREIWSNVTF